MGGEQERSSKDQRTREGGAETVALSESRGGKVVLSKGVGLSTRATMELMPMMISGFHTRR